MIWPSDLTVPLYGGFRAVLATVQAVMRYETGSLIITSNQPFADWDRIFPDAMMTVAAVDRIIHRTLERGVPGGAAGKSNPVISAARLGSDAQNGL